MHVTRQLSAVATQAAKKLIALKEHDFSRTASAVESTRALQAAEKLTALKGHDFSRVAKAIESTWALAPEGCFSPISSEIPSFSANGRKSKISTKLRPLFCCLLAAILVLPASAAPRKPHVVILGAVKRVSYSKAGDPAGATAVEDSLKIRPLLLDGLVKEWTTGDSHDVTDRSFVVRRVIRLNDALPSDAPLKNSARAPSTWVWQRGPWLLVDRVTGHVTPLKLPDFDPGVSQISWFRDYGAYCGVTASGKSLYAVVAQVAARKPVLAKKLAVFDAENHPDPVCDPAEWQREPLRITFHVSGANGVSFDIVPGSAVLVEDSGDEPETSAPQTEDKPK